MIPIMIQSKAKMITQAELDKTQNNLKKAQEEWKKRRKGCIAVAANFSE